VVMHVYFGGGVFLVCIKICILWIMIVLYEIHFWEFLTAGDGFSYLHLSIFFFYCTTTEVPWNKGKVERYLWS
jgi:hypothetical protein